MNKNTISKIFLSYVVEVVANKTCWNGSELQTTDNFSLLKTWEIYAYIGLSNEQKSSILFSGGLKFKDLIVEVKEIRVIGDCIIFYIIYINKNKKSKNDKQIKAVSRKLNKLPLLDDSKIKFKVEFINAK